VLICLIAALARLMFTPREETEHGTRPGGRGPGGVPGGGGSKNRGGACARIQRGVYPYSHFACVSVCLSVRRLDWTSQAIGQQHTSPYVLDVRRAAAKFISDCGGLDYLSSGGGLDKQ